MGSEKSIIETDNLPILPIKAKTDIQTNSFCPPFRKFKNQNIKINGKWTIASVQIEQPDNQQIQICQQVYRDLEDAFNYKTKQIQINSMLTDNEHNNLQFFLGYNNDKPITLQLKPFRNLNTYVFNNILYQIYMNQKIAQLNSPQLSTIKQRYIIQTGLQVEGQQNPNTQVFIFPPTSTNLSEIIKYRRQNKWPWTTSQFNALTLDLANALLTLHRAKLAHNDIRPCNVLYNQESNCYQLTNFSHTSRIKNFKSNNQNSKIMSISQIRSSTYYSSPDMASTISANLQKSDIYSLGVTLLCAFYLCEPINMSAITDYNNKYLQSYPVLSVILQMTMQEQKRDNMQILIKRIPQGEKPQRLKNLIESLRYKNNPKGIKQIQIKKMMSDAYKRLGIWDQWRNKHSQAYSMEQNLIDDYKKAHSLFQMAKIEYCKGDISASSDHAIQSSNMYRNLGYAAYDQGNLNQSLNLFTKAIQCSKYFQNGNDLDTAKNLQGLALIHAQKSQYQISKPLINESTLIVIKNLGTQSVDYCKIKMSQAKIESDFGQFQSANQILNQCVNISQRKTHINQQIRLKLKAQILHEIGRNAMMQSTYEQDTQRILINKAERYLSESLTINQKFMNNQLELANNMETLGQIQLRKQNYMGAKMNFKKADELRQIQNKRQNKSGFVRQKQKAETLCNIAACQAGIGNNQKAIQYYNEALSIYKKIYGSDHNKFSAMAIGNMSKVYYQLQDTQRAKDCLRLATQILSDLLGQQDPDYLHFKYLLEENMDNN